MYKVYVPVLNLAPWCYGVWRSGGTFPRIFILSGQPHAAAVSLPSKQTLVLIKKNLVSPRACLGVPLPQLVREVQYFDIRTFLSLIGNYKTYVYCKRVLMQWD